jgi:crossover junction endodeoxyribonuclease RusA
VYEFTLPYPVTVNLYWRKFRDKMVLSDRGKAYRNDVAAVLLPKRLKKLTGRLAVAIDYWMPDRRKRDIDNLQKGVFDSMASAGLFADDSQIDDMHVRRVGVDEKKKGYAVVRLWEIGGKA